MKRYILALPALLLLAGCNKDEINQEIDLVIPLGSSPYQTKVFEYVPAPGQFINDTATGGFTSDIDTPEAAANWALQRLKEQRFVSLGAFGGYIVVGFDHSIQCHATGYDFAILGNAFDSAQGASNEPGVVWVMQDTNHNGLPDDVWYELRGSETGAEGTISNYAVTYYRPAEPKQPVMWTDSQGNSGQIDYLPGYHKQDYYYPGWIKEDKYTLTGTRLAPRNVQDAETGLWSNLSYSWGYADNVGSDVLSFNTKWVGFKIVNAMKVDGTPVELTHIDFVKVQGAVLSQSGWLGENSCEVFSIADYTLLTK